MKPSYLLGLVLFLLPNMMSAQSISAKKIIEKSIQYHDPQGLLSSQEWTMHFEDSRPDGSTNSSYFKFNPTNYDFEIKRKVKGFDVIMNMTNGEFVADVKSDNSDFKITELDSKSTSEERAVMMRNYYHYLWCMPMKINDPGTIVDDKVNTVDFFGKASLEIKVTYTPEVGKDIWYFYFHPETYAMHGYRFYHDEAANDGEYITLDKELESNGVRIPQVRKWYTHKEAKFLGEDKLVRLEMN